MTSSAAEKPKLTLTHWLILVIAVIGFAFDIYELLMLPLIVKPALAALGGLAADGTPRLVPGTVEYTQWARMLFFVPAIAGGIFGLIGGYLTDLWGRRRVLTGSILLYGFSAFAAGFATTLPQLLVLRCLVFIGVCVEFVAAVAWLAELFPDPKLREKVLGYTQAFSSIGGLMVALANEAAITWSASLPAIHGAHEAWRYTLISGLIPAIPLMLIRPFLPESPEWQRKKSAGELKRPSIAAIFAPELLRTTLVTALLFAASYGVAFGAIQHLPQIIPSHADVKVLAKKAEDTVKETAAAAGKPAPTPKQLAAARAKVGETAAAKIQKWQEVGGLVGRCLLAILAVHILSRRMLFRVFQIPCLLFVPALFWMLSRNLDSAGTLTNFTIAVFFAGMLTVGQFSFWGNYLPLAYPVHLRGTGESFAANIGGRVLGTSAAWFTLTLSASTPPNPGKLALMAALVAGTFALVGAIFTHWLPEPKTELISK